MGTRVVKNYPSPRLMETIGATNQKPAEAIGELVANSFDARIDNERIKIVVVFLASFFWKKLQAFLENVASPFWRKLQPHGVAGATPWKQTFFVKSY